MELNWTSAALTDQGICREENQDALVYSPENKLFAVSDGMGGVAFGKRTAMLVSTMLTGAAAQLARWEDSSEALARELARYIRDISDNIQRLGNPEGVPPAFGATLTGFLIHNHNAVIFNVGDSRVYRLRRDSDCLERMTVDHSLVQILLETGDLTEEEAWDYPERSVITQYMGMTPSIEPAVKVEPLEPGDLYLVCSDGLHGMLREPEIAGMLDRKRTPEELCARLVQAANDAGGKDNISVVIWSSEPADAPQAEVEDHE